MSFCVENANIGYIQNIKRDYLGEYKVLCLELEKYPDKYFKYFRMSKEKFDILLELIAHKHLLGLFSTQAMSCHVDFFSVSL